MSNIRELSQLASVIHVNDETRNVGIGTSNPESKLSIAGDLTASGNITAASFYGTVVGYATEGYVTQQISNLVGDAPEALNTLNELASALNDDSSFATTVTNSLSTKISGVGIQSGGISVGTGITTLNFIGAGNTFAINGNIVDVSISGGGGGASVSIGTEAPESPNAGDLWYSLIYGRTFIYYEDDDSSQWVDSSPFNLGILDSLSELTVSGIVSATSFYGDGSNLTGISAGSTVADDTSTNSTFYPLFTSQISGTITESKVSTTKLSYNPFDGEMTAINFNSTSDIRLKENIHQIKDPLEKIMQINGVAFNWKDNKEAAIGVIAQDIEEIFPELVKENEHHKSVNYNGLIGVLIEAMKEQQRQIEELKLLNKREKN
jgi:hypothetical protein